MNIILNTAAGIFCLLIPATLLASGWNVLAPAAWCWLERGTAAIAGAIATGLLFLFVWSYMEAEKKSSQNTHKNAPGISDGNWVVKWRSIRHAAGFEHWQQDVLRTRYVNLRGLSVEDTLLFWQTTQLGKRLFERNDVSGKRKASNHDTSRAWYRANI